MKPAYIGFLLCSAIVCIQASMTILNTDTHYFAPRIYFEEGTYLSNQTVEGPIILYKKGVNNLKDFEINGSIVVGNFDHLRQSDVDDFIEMGVNGIVLTCTTTKFCEWSGRSQLILLSSPIETGLLILQICITDFISLEKLINSDPNATWNAVIVDDDENLWVWWMDSVWWLLYQIFFFSWNFILLVSAITKFVQFKIYMNKIPPLAAAVLSLETVCVTLRLIWSVDVYVRHFYNGFANSLNILSNSFSLSILSTFLVAFFWHDSLSLRSLKVNSFLDKMKIPIIVLIVILTCIEISMNIIRTWGYNNADTSAASKLVASYLIPAMSVYCSIQAILLLYFNITAVRVLIMIKLRPSASIKRTATKMLICALGLLITLVGALLVLSPQFGNPAIFLLYYFLYHFGMSLSSTSQIFTFEPKATLKKSPSGTPNKKKMELSKIVINNPREQEGTPHTHRVE